MRKCLALLLIMSQVIFASEYVIQTEKGELRLNATQLSLIADNIDNEILTSNISAKNKTLVQLSSAFRELADDLEQDRAEAKKPIKLKLRKLLLGASKGLTAVSVHSARPFMASAGFLKGFFQKVEKNQDSFEFLSFYLNHTKKFDNLYKTVDSLEEYSEKTFEIIETILVEKMRIIAQDSLNKLLEKNENDDLIKISKDSILISLGLDKKVVDQRALSLSQIASSYIGEFNISYYSPDLINEHPEYQEVRGILGDFSADDLNTLFMSDSTNAIGEKAASLDFESIMEGAKISIAEGLGAFAAQLFIPKIVLGTISKSVGNIVFLPILAADLGFISSALVCSLNKNVQASIASGDEELKSFCNYTLIKSAYIMSRSKARGFVSGKKAKVKFLNFTRKVGKKFKSLRKKEPNQTVL